MQAVKPIAAILLIVGALNWGLMGLGNFMGANWNVVNQLLGAWPSVEWIVYILVGVAGVMAVINWKRLVSAM